MIGDACRRFRAICTMLPHYRRAATTRAFHPDTRCKRCISSIKRTLVLSVPAVKAGCWRSCGRAGQPPRYSRNSCSGSSIGDSRWRETRRSGGADTAAWVWPNQVSKVRFTRSSAPLPCRLPRQGGKRVFIADQGAAFDAVERRPSRRCHGVGKTLTSVSGGENPGVFVGLVQPREDRRTGHVFAEWDEDLLIVRAWGRCHRDKPRTPSYNDVLRR